MSYQPVEAQQKKTVSVTQSCRVLDVVSRSGYYAQRQHLLEAPSVCAIGVKLQAAFAASGHTYGCQRLCAALRNEGIAIGRHRTRSLMRKHQVRPVWKRKFVNTTNSKHDLPISPNLLNRWFEVAAPNQAWVSDITYIRTRTGYRGLDLQPADAC